MFHIKFDFRDRIYPILSQIWKLYRLADKTHSFFYPIMLISLKFDKYKLVK